MSSHSDQHASGKVSFKGSWQCAENLYEIIRRGVIHDIKETTDWADRVDLTKTNIRRFRFEDGVCSYEAVHPDVVHEDETDIEE